MPAPKDNIKICQGSLYEVAFQYEDEQNFGIDITSAQIRKQIRTPTRESQTIVISLQEGATPTTSGFEVVDPVVVSPIAISEFGAENTVVVNGGPFIRLVKRTTEDADGNITAIEIVSENVVEIGDLAIISGSTFNDAPDWRISAVIDANTIEICKVSKSVTPESPATGTIQIERHGRFIERIVATDSESFDFEQGEYDIEILIDPSKPEEKKRIVQGSVRLDLETTKT